MSLDPEIVSFTMSRIRGKDTGIERKLRKRLYQDGYRFLCNSKRAFGHPDFLFPALRLAVFADSEFWHGYRFAENESKLVTHRDYWVSKIKRNMARDAEVNAELQRQGYKVLRFWGFEINKDFERVIKIIEETAERRKRALCLAKRPKEFTTLSYYKHDGRYLLLYRDKKEKDLNKGKYVGIGGHLEKGETYLQAAKREFKEETGLTVSKQVYLGRIDFVDFPNYSERMYLFRIDGASGDINPNCDEGELLFIDENNLFDLPMWEGDKIFLPRLQQNERFRLVLVYENGELVDAIGPVDVKR